MKGDFSRNTFDKKKRFTSVRMQQGRVQLDADWNEQMDIIDNRIRVGSEDFIGGSGAPSGAPGYKITPTKTDLTIGKGRFYVQGVLIEKDEDEVFTKQTDFPNALLPTTTGLYLAYLDVWQQGVSAVIDPDIEEPALNGADTTMRIKNRAQVKLFNVETTGVSSPITCEKLFDKTSTLAAVKNNLTKWNNLVSHNVAQIEPVTLGKLSAKVSANANLKNQLYRVEIHKGGDEKTATFKWSRDNGALVVSIKNIVDNVITISSTQNRALNFKPNQWVELSTRTRELQNKPGIFVQLIKVDRESLTLSRKLTTTEQSEFKINGTVRRWNVNSKDLANKNVQQFFTVVSQYDKTSKKIKITLDEAKKLSNVKIGTFIELKKDNNSTKTFISQVEQISQDQKILTVKNLDELTEDAIKSLTLMRVMTSAIISIKKDIFMPLENGLEIKFEKGTYKTGDYWLIPTRAETNNIESAQYNFKISQLPEGIVHYYAQLALVRKTSTTWELTDDCRKTISALGNEAYKSEPGDNEGSVFVDKNGVTNIKKLKNLTQLPEKDKAPMADNHGYINKKWLLADSDIDNLMRLSNGNWISDLQSLPEATSDAAVSVVDGKIYIIGGHSGHSISSVKQYEPLTNRWTYKAYMPTARNALSSATVNGKIYAIGGWDGSLLATVEMYDPITNKWFTKNTKGQALANMNVPRGAVCVTVNGKIYAIGGQIVVKPKQYTGLIEEYDPNTNQWVTKKATCSVRGSFAAGVVNGKIYIFGGWDGNKIVDTVEEYDPITDQCTLKGKMLTKRRALSVAVYHGKIYVFAGHNGNNVPLNTVEEYDPVTNTWKTKTSMPMAKYSVMVGVVNSSIYVIGGSNGKDMATVEEYHPDVDRWTQNRVTPMSTSRAYQTAAVVNGKLYVIGGKNSALLKSVEEYDPFSNRWTPKKSIPVSSIRATSVGVVNGKIYIVGGITSSSYSKAVWEYDPIKNDWLQKKDLESTKGWGTSSVVDGKIYIFDGVGNRDIEVYDPIVNNGQGQGKLIGKVSKQLLGATSNVVNGKIYLIGGADSGNAKVGVTRVDEYDPASYKDDKNWQPIAKAPMPTARGFLTSTVINGKIYVFGGTTKDGSGGVNVDIVEVYDPIANTWNTAASMPTARSGISSGVIDGRAYIVGGFSNRVEIYLPAAIENKKIEINTQKEFETIFGNGRARVTIPENKTIILNPIQGVVQGDLLSGAWGGKGNDSGNTYNGQPAYILKNAVNLSSNVSIIGFNQETTIVIKEKADNKFHVIGTTAKPVTGIQLRGWSFDGRGGVAVDRTKATTPTLGGNLVSTTVGGAFTLNVCRNLKLNCKIINCKTTANGGAIEGAGINTSHITAKHIYNCSAKNGGGVAAVFDSDITVYYCVSVRTAAGGETGKGAGVYTCQRSRIDAYYCYSTHNGGGADRCKNIVLNACYCKAKSDGGGAASCENSTIHASNCSAETQGGGIHACEYIIVSGNWFGNEAPSGANIRSSSWAGLFAIGNQAKYQNSFKNNDI